MADVVGDFIRGHQAGQAEQDHQQQLEDNKIRSMVLKHQLAGLKIEDQLRAREVAKQQFDLMNNQPAADLPTDTTTTAQPNLPSQNLAGVVNGLVSSRLSGNMGGAPDATAAPAPAPTFTPSPAAQSVAPGTNPVTTTAVRPVTIPGVDAIGDAPAVAPVTIRPKSTEDLAAATVRAELAKALNSTYKVAPGEKVQLHGQTIAEGGPKLIGVPAGGLADASTGGVVTPGPGSLSEFGQFQQTYAEGLGEKSFKDLSPQQKAGVFPAFTKAKQDPAMQALLLATRQAGLDRTKGTSTTPGDFTKTGDDFLQSIPIQWRKTVDKIARYEEDPTKVASMRGGMRETLSQWVNQVNPGYKADEFAVRAPTRKAYTTGTQGQQITAINTAIGHLDQLAPIVARLDNGSFTPGNEAYNKLKTIFGSSKVTNFDTLKDALAGEVASVLSKGSATVSGIAAEKAKINSASSPEQLADYVRTQIPIMGSKLAGLDYAFHQAMGEDDTYSALSPSSKKILAKYGFDPAEHGAAAAASQPPIASTGALAQVKLANGQIQVTAPDGSAHMFATQAAADRFKAAVAGTVK